MSKYVLLYLLMNHIQYLRIVMLIQNKRLVNESFSHLIFRVETKSDVVIGDDVFKLHPDMNYNVHFPFKRGDINVHSGVGGSETAILADLEAIWCFAVESVLGIPKSEFPNLKAVIVIPALYKRSFVKHYMTLALAQIGFGQAFVLQDHVAATFGAGLGNIRLCDNAKMNAEIIVIVKATDVSLMLVTKKHPFPVWKMEYLIRIREYIWIMAEPIFLR